MYFYRKKGVICQMLSSFKQTMAGFASSTALHGFKYLLFCQHQRHLVERLVWALVCLLAILSGLYLAVLATQKYYEDPTIINFVKVNFLRAFIHSNESPTTHPALVIYWRGNQRSGISLIDADMQFSL